MKRFSLKNGIILVLLFAFIFVISSLFFRIIYQNIVKNNTSSNIENVAITMSTSVDLRMHSDYNLLDELIKTIPSEYNTTNKKIDYLNSLIASDKIPFFASIEGTKGFGQYGKYTHSRVDTLTYTIVTDVYNSSYTIDEYVFVGKNAKNTPEDPYEKQDVNICNLGTEYIVIDITTDLEIANPMIEQDYVIYRFDDLICYFKASDYLSSIFNGPKSLEFTKYFIFGADGKIVYQNTDNKNNVFYDLIKTNNPLKILDIASLISTIDSVEVINAINLDKEAYYMSLTKLFDSSDNNLYVALFFTQASLNKVLRQITIPLVVLFLILDVSLIVACFIIYVLSVRKTNQLSQIQLYQGYQSVYRIKINKQGKIVFMDNGLKRLLLEPKNYKTIKDLKAKNFKEDDDINLAIRLQKELIVLFDSNETISENKLFIRFIPTKYYSERILIGKDVTEEENRNAVYHVLALYNDATKLPNRHVLTVDLQEEIKEKRKDPSSIYHTYVVSLDIKDFDNINSLFGQTMGGKVLKLVAEKIKESLENFNFNLYYFQDSILIVVLKQITEANQISDWIREVLIEFKKPVEIEENSIVLNLYFAYYRINLIDTPSLTSTDIIDNSVRTLQRVMNYAHKRFDEYDLSIGRFTTTDEVLVQDLRQAVNNHEFVMYLQPQYSLGKEVIVGFEALLRWNNPKYKNQSTEHFIKLAEKNSLIVQIGRFVIDETFRMAKLLEPHNIIVSLNISPVQILQAGFVQEVITAAEKHQIKPENIALEITETFLMTNFEISNEKLKILRKYGFGVHLDDFGTGYSSMLYLNELNIDVIKIDREFVRNVTTDQVSRTIITKIISLAKSLSIGVICEGVEEEKQATFLSRNGCDLIQGYLISKPAPYDDMLNLLISYNYDPETKKPKTAIAKMAPTKKKK